MQAFYHGCLRSNATFGLGRRAGILTLVSRGFPCSLLGLGFDGGSTLGSFLPLSIFPSFYILIFLQGT